MSAKSYQAAYEGLTLGEVKLASDIAHGINAFAAEANQASGLGVERGSLCFLRGMVVAMAANLSTRADHGFASHAAELEDTLTRLRELAVEVAEATGKLPRGLQ